ncbi:hypothetical protein LXL04_023327 [Taraxacum kok-saghyz]
MSNASTTSLISNHSNSTCAGYGRNIRTFTVSHKGRFVLGHRPYLYFTLHIPYDVGSSNTFAFRVISKSVVIPSFRSSCRLKIGTSVEVIQNEQGLEGSYYVGVVID